MKALPDGERFSSYGLAVISAAVGDIARAVGYWDEAFASYDDLMVLLMVDSGPDDLRDDARFQKLLQRMAFPKP